MTITLTSKNQITLPKKLINEMHLTEGALFNIQIKGNRIELIPLEVIEKVFSDAEYKKLEDLYQGEKHLVKEVTAKTIENL
jgi:AbrB family looped-hinge helix DNA binding protein